MDAVGGQEVLFPVVLPADLWMESGRFESVGSELVRMKDRSGHDNGTGNDSRGSCRSFGPERSNLLYQISIYDLSDPNEIPR